MPWCNRIIYHLGKTLGEAGGLPSYGVGMKMEVGSGGVSQTHKRFREHYLMCKFI